MLPAGGTGEDPGPASGVVLSEVFILLIENFLCDWVWGLPQEDSCWVVGGPYFRGFLIRVGR